MINQTVANANKIAHSRMPKLTRDVGVGVPSGMKFHAHATDEVPAVERHHVGRPGASSPVAAYQVLLLFQQFFLVGNETAFAEIRAYKAFIDYIRQNGAVWNG